MTRIESEQQRFLQVCQQVMEQEHVRSGIGTLGEKTLHAVIKQYLQPDPARREVKIGRHVADIADGTWITEVQTRSFSALRPRLEAFLPHYQVEVVYPVARRKWLRWIDAQGEVSEPRRSPKLGQPMDICYELCRLPHAVGREGLRFRILLIDMEEYRLLDGWGRGGKRGSSCYERIPLSLEGEFLLHRPEDLLEFLPQGLQQPFTVYDLQKSCRRSENFARKMKDVLEKGGVLQCCGKQGRRVLYCAKTTEKT